MPAELSKDIEQLRQSVVKTCSLLGEAFLNNTREQLNHVSSTGDILATLKAMRASLDEDKPLLDKQPALKEAWSRASVAYWAACFSLGYDEADVQDFDVSDDSQEGDYTPPGLNL